MKILGGLQEGQVLQRLGAKGATVKITGEFSGTGGAIHATISGPKGNLKRWKTRLVGRSKGNSFIAKFFEIPAGGPYRLELHCGKQSTHVSSFYVGDVWLLAGQSNMEGCGNMAGAAKPHPLIRAFSMRREWRAATDPLHILSESPDTCHSEGKQPSREEIEHYRKNATKGVGAGLFFAREMLERSGVPQALICTAHGGTSMSQWNPDLKDAGGDSMYGSMLLSMKATGQPVAGMLWYQGESDTSINQAAEYTGRMKQLVAATRRDLRQPGLPWIIVQISRVIGPRDDVASWNSIQEQERLLPEVIKNLETVSAIDLALDDNIHISAKSFPRLASRLARAADSLVYRNKKETPPPRLRAVVALGSSMAKNVEPGMGIDVIFDHVGKGLQAASEPRGFTILDSQGRVWPYIFKITLHGNIIRLFLGAKLVDGARLSYGHGVDPDCNIIDSRGYALPVFGPIALERPGMLLPFVTHWKRTAVVPCSRSLGKIACPDQKAFDAPTKNFSEDGFIQEHDQWLGKTGHVYYWSRLELAEPMKLEFLMGYDGPFRLWLDGKPFFEALDGTNPCLPDEGSRTAILKRGTHKIAVAMDTNGGRAWGFFLRFRRLDCSQKSSTDARHSKPAYCI